MLIFISFCILYGPIAGQDQRPQRPNKVLFFCPFNNSLGKQKLLDLKGVAVGLRMVKGHASLAFASLI